MSGFAAALRAELYVALRSTSARLVVILPALLAMAQLLLVRIRSGGEQARDNLLGSGGLDFAADNAWGYYVDSLLSGLTLLALALAAYTAWSFASDRDSGVLRHLLIRRSSRRAVVLAKLLAAHLVALCALLGLMLAATALAAWLWEFGPVVEDGFELIGAEEIREEFRLGLVLALLPLPATIAFALLVAVATSSATQAVTAALGLSLAMDIFKGALGNAANWLHVSYQPSLIDQSYLSDVSRLVRGYSDVMLDPDVLQLNQWVPLPWLFVFAALTLALVPWRRL